MRYRTSTGSSGTAAGLPTAFLVWALTLLLAACQPDAEHDQLSRALSGQDTEGYLRATVPRPFVFPRDHAQHTGYKNEWWYFTGNLSTAQGRRFGYQLTFFRVALSPQTPARQSKWATQHGWMAHVAVTDPAGGKHYFRERFAREAVGLAGNQADPFMVWLEDWRIRSEGSGFPWQLTVATEDFDFSLQVTPTKPVVPQGDRGLSQKSPEPGNASYYYSIPRLTTRGQLRLQEQTFTVSGLSWLDREWGTSLLGQDQQGWDWFALQLDNGDDLMYYRLRDAQGKPHAASRGSLIRADGSVTTIHPRDIRLTPLAWWTAPNGARYAIRWRLQLQPLKTEWIVGALLAEQFMAVSIPYWEGAVAVVDGDSGLPLGRGYLEMAGY